MFNIFPFIAYIVIYIRMYVYLGKYINIYYIHIYIVFSILYCIAFFYVWEKSILKYNLTLYKWWCVLHVHQHQSTIHSILYTYTWYWQWLSELENLPAVNVLTWETKFAFSTKFLLWLTASYFLYLIFWKQGLYHLLLTICDTSKEYKSFGSSI